MQTYTYHCRLSGNRFNSDLAGEVTVIVLSTPPEMWISSITNRLRDVIHFENHLSARRSKKKKIKLVELTNYNLVFCNDRSNIELSEFLDSLPPKDKTIAELLIEGNSLSEIATTLGLTISDIFLSKTRIAAKWLDANQSTSARRT